MVTGKSHRWKVLGVGVAANASFSSVVGGLPATAVFMRSTYQLGNTELGLVLGMLGLGIAVSEIPWGLITDRWGDRPVLLAGLFSSAIAMLTLALLAAFAPTAMLLAAGLFAVGLLGSSVNGASGRAIMAWFKEGERGLAMSIRQTAVPGGYALGAVFLPWLAHAHGFFEVFAVSAAACVVSGLFAWAWLFEPDFTSPVSVEAGSTGKGPLQDLGVWRIVLAIGLLCAPQFATLTYAAIFLHDFGKVDITVVSATLAAIQAGAIVSRIWSGRWTDKHNNRRSYLKTCASLSAITFLLLGLTVSVASTSGLNTSPIFVWVIIGVMVVAGIAVSAWHGVAYTELATLAGASRAGTALAMGNTCVFIVLFLTPIAASALTSHISWASVWLAGSICALVAVPLFPHVLKSPAVALKSHDA
ncbi:MFS transporter [Pseudomonas oryzihabitans]|uniref:MFS transporter n=2 Tax=Pseudomonas TaxID=286 RepID=UPI0005C98A29|nr:MFS transporter [Pseudomonas oryzihabitans]KIZ49867.1 MFS transporter [Pseudomonas oryzihabitans]